MSFSIRPESERDYEAIRQVNTRAFGQADEAKLVEALREGEFLRVSLVAEAAGRVNGHILFSRVDILTDDATVDALAMAPVAVDPEFQNQGVGSQLVRDGLSKCKAQGHQIVIVLGDPHFYRRFGFSADLATCLQSPYAGDNFMAVELVPNALLGLRGEVRYPEPFAAL